MSHANGSADSSLHQTGRDAAYRIRLRLFLPIVFCLLIGLVSLLIISIIHRSATDSIASLAEEVMTRVSQRVVDKTNHYLDSAAHAVRMNAVVWQPGGAIGPGSFLEFFHRSSLEQLRLFPYFGLIYYGDEQGNHWLNKREQDGTLHVRVITRKEDSPASRQALEQWAKRAKGTEQERQQMAQGLAPYLETVWYEPSEGGSLVRGESDPIKIYDPRLRPWYAGAKAQQKLFWTDVYAWEEKYRGVTGYQVGITVSAPVVRGGQLAGVCGIDISLQAVSHFLRDLEIMKHGRAFILNGQGEAVGLPRYEEVLEKGKADQDGVKLTHVSRIADGAVVASHAALRAALGLNEGQPVVLQKERVITFQVEGQPYYGFYKPFAAELGLNWTVGVVIPEEDFLGDVRQEMHRSLLVALVSACLMIGVGVLMGRLITNPLTHLGREVESIMALDLAPSPSLVTRIQEFRMISLAFTRLKLTLAGMVNTVSVHAKTLDWTAEEFGNMALTLEDGTRTLQEGVEAMQGAVQQLVEETPAREALRHSMGQVEESLRTLHQLNQPVVEQVERMNQSAYALRETLQSVRI